ncbi:MAG TPA: hypothetical protein EYH45_03285 [Candidatus Caldiarchaeum subterraneum]|uniref:Polyprenyl synthetase family protein n=1 Tax=Caldiarchaeum subterraneum TaxID=311458 RepID=A0A833E9L6_CALS0|nr:hypothetical protein [Candidatus Caldarchaeum subterraneum]
MLVEEAGLQQLLNTLREDLEQHIQRRIHGRSDRFLIQRAILGGKRLRPLLLLVTFKALNGEDYEKALDVACALELAHSASLMHDDILDLDYRRRGELSIWRHIGVGKALLQGHRIINFAFETVLEKGIELARIFVEAWDKASKGILNEVLLGRDISEELYLLIIREKTASLFEAATESAAVLAGVDEQAKYLVKQYGVEVGTAYQLADDLVDSLRNKRYGGVMFLMQDFKERFLKALIASKTGKFSTLVKAFSPKHPSEEFIIRQVAYRISKARQLASSGLIPDNPYKEALKQLPLYFITQMLREKV